ncbi:MAG: trigger factor [Cyclobacteriaceae bacterium]|nr:trigger factor [Cyclobacteriaceae bacterium]HQQ83334.1 trigger factor [Cyclobacteriaceae bacterium]
MNITLDKPSATDGTIRITLQETDYLPKVEEKVKEYSRKMNIKGFRQGHVPAGVVRKMFGKSILVEEVNHLLSHSVSEYIKEKNLKVLGDPLPNQDKARNIDWDTQKEFEFEFQIGLVEDFKVDISSGVKVKSYEIEVDNKVMDETLEDIKRRFGNITYPETSGESDNLFGEVTNPAGEQKSSYIQISKLSKGEQKKFIGLKKDDVVSFDVQKLSKDFAVVGQAINLTEEEAKTATGTYSIKVTNISHVEPAEINAELFDKVFGKDAVKTEEEFMNKIRETISENYQRESNHLLEHEIQHHLNDHTKVNMPDQFLKTWLKSTGDGTITDEVIEKEFNEYRNGLKWDLIKTRIAEDHQIKVDGTEVRNRAKELIAQQFGGPAIAEQLGDKFDSIADNYLSGQDGKGENFMRLYNQIRQEKIMKVVKENITIQSKKVTLDEFKELAAAHQH